MQLRTAQKQKARLRLGVAGPSGSGKTYSALLLASGIVPWEKICVIDTENGSGDLYANLGPYNVITLTAPFTPERYVEAIHEAETAGMELIIIDSITHEWNGKGGCLEIADNITKASPSHNSYTSWAQVTPRHNAFVNAILQSPCHVITTTRKVQDYDMSKNDQGKTQIQKVGLKDVTREGFEYELTTSFNLAMNHMTEVSKDRTSLFDGKDLFIISQDTGKKLAAWLDSGVAPIPVVETPKPTATPQPPRPTTATAPANKPATGPLPLDEGTAESFLGRIDLINDEDSLKNLYREIMGFADCENRKRLVATVVAKNKQLKEYAAMIPDDIPDEIPEAPVTPPAKAPAKKPAAKKAA